MGGAAAVALTWLFAFSDPLPSVGWEVLAGAVTLVLATAGLVGVAGRPLAPGSRRRIPLLPTVVPIVVAVATARLCATRAPMWLRFYQARPALLELAAETQRGGGHHGSLAGTYYLEDFGLQDDRFADSDDSGDDINRSVVFFDTNTAALLTEAGYLYSPLGDPAGVVGAGGPSNVRYRHLTGPWWTHGQDIF